MILTRYKKILIRLIMILIRFIMSFIRLNIAKHNIAQHIKIVSTPGAGTWCKMISATFRSYSRTHKPCKLTQSLNH